MNNEKRRSFLKKIGLGSASLVAAPSLVSAATEQAEIMESRLSAAKGEPIKIALIGTGGMGIGNMNTALRTKNFEITAACDLYDGRLKRAKELYGEDIFTTRDYKEILKRKDVEAVIIATTDHWHEQISIEALEAGLPIYCEKPMVQKVEEGYNVIEAVKKNKGIFQVGSQRVSSLVYEKAKELFEAGEIGELNFAEGYWDRFSATGAWQYSIPLDANDKTVDWKAYRKDLGNKPFDAKHFFRWRNYQAYGTGIPGDLFVHLFSGLHLITSSLGPEKIYASGGLRYWEDGRDVEDMVLGMFDYGKTEQHPAFNLVLRVNFADGSGGGSKIRLVGSEGEIEIRWDSVILRKKKLPNAPGMSINTFDEEMRDKFKEQYYDKYPEAKRGVMSSPYERVFKAPKGYNDRFDHFNNFYEAIKNGKKIVEDAEFGMRACAPAILCNQSIHEKKIIQWDPVNMKVVG